jgi:hypothetical protein
VITTMVEPWLQTGGNVPIELIDFTIRGEPEVVDVEPDDKDC